MDAAVTMIADGTETEIAPWSTVVVPAAVPLIGLRSAASGPCALVARPQPDLGALRAAAGAAGQADAEAFFKQFA